MHSTMGRRRLAASPRHWKKKVDMPGLACSTPGWASLCRPPPSDELSRAVARLNVIPVASISHMSETAVGDDLAAHKEIVEAVEATTSYFNFLF